MPLSAVLFAAQMPLCYHPCFDFRLDGLVTKASVTDVLFPGYVEADTRREDMISELEQAGITVQVRVTLATSDVHHAMRG